MAGLLVGTVVVLLLPQLLERLYDYHLLIFSSILLLVLLLMPEELMGGLEAVARELLQNEAVLKTYLGG